MSEHNSEVWAEFSVISKPMVLVEQRLTERIIALEAEVTALRGEPQPGREVYQDAREIDWREQGAAQAPIAAIMKP